MTNEIYLKESLELNLFFLRIMKEHGFFIAVGFPHKNNTLIDEAMNFNTSFNNHLRQVVNLAKNMIPIQNDAITEYTLRAENKTSELSGIVFDTDLTKEEMRFAKSERININETLIANVSNLNNRSIGLTRNLVLYKTKVLDNMIGCNLYNTNYPLLIDHIRREALLFIEMLRKLQNRENPIDTLKDALDQEAFWNLIMAEHSEFIRGYLDPSERELIKLADDFAKKFYALERKVYVESKDSKEFIMTTNKTITATSQIRDFKIQGTEGLLDCKIKSIILPLLGDHVIREANHYLSLLEKLRSLS